MVKLVLKGELNWVRTGEPDHKFDNETTKGKWSAQLLPDAESLEIIRDLQAEGLKNVLKKNDENKYFTNFSRVFQKTDKEGKIIKTWTPPYTLDANNENLDPKILGNGSKGEIHLDVYEHPTPTGGKAKAARLEGVKITEVVSRENRTSF